MIRSFGNKTAEDVYHGDNTKEARKLPNALHATASRKLDALDAAKVLADLRIPSGNRLHALKDDLAGFHSISINDQYRIIFRWKDGDAHDVQITDYH